MTAPTHIVTGLATVVVVGRVTGVTPDAVSLMAIVFGSLAPDIDGTGYHQAGNHPAATHWARLSKPTRCGLRVYCGGREFLLRTPRVYPFSATGVVYLRAWRLPQ